MHFDVKCGILVPKLTGIHRLSHRRERQIPFIWDEAAFSKPDTVTPDPVPVTDTNVPSTRFTTGEVCHAARYPFE